MRRIAVALAFALTATGSVARAQAPTNEQLAQALFDEGRELMDTGDPEKIAKACPLLERSQKLGPGGGTLLNLAICYERAHRMATAYTTFNEALSQARKAGRQDREDIALTHLDAIAPKLPKLRVSLQENIDTVVVQIDETLMGPAVLGVLTPVDPGPHHVRVSAQNRTPWEWSGTLAEGEKKELDVILAQPAPADPCAFAPDKCAKAKAAPHQEKRWSPVSYVALAVGGVSLTTSLVTGILALGAKSAFEGECIPSRSYCTDPAQGASDLDRMKALAWTSTITLGVGVVAGVVMLAWPKRVILPKIEANGVAFRF
jgi:hypothetical protein